MKQWFLPSIIGVLATISLATVGSVRPDLLPKQLLFFILGAGVYYFAQNISFTRWLEWRWWLYGATLVLLVLPMLLGHSSRNTSRWIELGFFRLQPSQLAIPLVALSGVWLLRLPSPTLSHLRKYLATLIAPTLLIFISPDLGTTVIFLSVFLCILWFAQVEVKQLLLLGLVGLLVVSLSWFFVFKPYQRERMISFIAGTQQADQQHYNAAQALIAVGAGNLMGTGWGKGTQARLQFLPEKQTDFIFSSFAQEYGFVGTTLLLVTSLSGVIYLLVAARRVSEKPASVYLIAAAMTLFFQASVNIGMNIGLFPITGVTLPFVSYGGSSILALCLLLGICGSILKRTQPNTHQSSIHVV
jgi:rod shape determining protein RodA